MRLAWIPLLILLACDAEDGATPGAECEARSDCAGGLCLATLRHGKFCSAPCLIDDQTGDTCAPYGLACQVGEAVGIMVTDSTANPRRDFFVCAPK